MYDSSRIFNGNEWDGDNKIKIEMRSKKIIRNYLNNIKD